VAHRVQDFDENGNPKPGGRWVQDRLFLGKPGIEFCPVCKRVKKFCECEVKDGVKRDEG